MSMRLVLISIATLLLSGKHFDNTFFHDEKMNACELKVHHLNNNNETIKAKTLPFARPILERFWDSHHGEALCPVRAKSSVLDVTYLSQWLGGGADSARSAAADADAAAPFGKTRSAFWDWFFAKYVTDEWIPDLKAMYLRFYCFVTRREYATVKAAFAAPPEQQKSYIGSLSARSIEWLSGIDLNCTSTKRLSELGLVIGSIKDSVVDKLYAFSDNFGRSTFYQKSFLNSLFARSVEWPSRICLSRPRSTEWLSEFGLVIGSIKDSIAKQLFVFGDDNSRFGHNTPYQPGWFYGTATWESGSRSASPSSSAADDSVRTTATTATTQMMPGSETHTVSARSLRCVAEPAECDRIQQGNHGVAAAVVDGDSNVVGKGKTEGPEIISFAEFFERHLRFWLIYAGQWLLFLSLYRTNAMLARRKEQQTRFKLVYGLAIRNQGFSNKDAALQAADHAMFGLKEFKATQKAIGKVYRQMGKKYHPDKVPADQKEEAEAKMQQINAAKERLMEAYRTDPIKKMVDEYEELYGEK